MTRPKVKLHWCADYTTACLAMNALLAERYLGDPDVIDSMTIKVVPCEVVDSDEPARALAAWPTQEGVTGDNLLMVYFGDHSAPCAC